MTQRTQRISTIASEVRLRLVYAFLVTVAVSGEHNLARTVVQRQLSPPAIASASVGGDGRFVVFESLAQLLLADTNPIVDAFMC
jgi:hypothetical protein